MENIGEKKPFIITNAVIKEGICSYGYEIGSGPCEGDRIKNRMGSSEVHNDMIDAFHSLQPHLAVLDDAFTTGAGFDEIQGEDAIHHYSVSGFTVVGSDENEGFILMGEKWVRHGSITLKTPKITKASSYPHFEELLEAIEGARQEVELYMGGKAAPKYIQPELGFQNTGDASGGDEFDNPM